MAVQLYRAGLFPAGRNRILPPRLEPGQLFYAPLLTSLDAMGGGDVTPTLQRASVATAHNASGYLYSVGNNLPRFGMHGLLTEGLRSNALKYTEDLTQAVLWKVVNSSITADATASPYVGSPAIADKLCEDATTNYHTVYQEYVGVGSQKDSVSVYVKGGERTWVALGWWDYTGGVIEVFFNTATGTFGTLSVTPGTGGVSIFGTPVVEQLAEDWWRISYTVQTGVNTQRGFDLILASADGVSSYAGTNGWGAYFIGAQVEKGAWFASSYIFASFSFMSRYQDKLTYLAAGNTPLGDEGTIECVFRARSIVLGQTPLTTQDSVNQHGAEILATTGTGQLLSSVISATQQQGVVDGFFLANTDVEAVWAFKSGDAELYKDGVSGGIDWFPSNLTHHSIIRIGAAGTISGNVFFGWVREVKVWEVRRHL